ncbi:MAG: hypothetical protein WCG07_03150 [Candidatus Taylorbacteria bacterium]
MKTPQTVVPPELHMAIKEEIRALQNPRSPLIRHINTFAHLGLTATLRIMEGFTDRILVMICRAKQVFDTSRRAHYNKRKFDKVYYNMNGTLAA